MPLPVDPTEPESGGRDRWAGGDLFDIVEHEVVSPLGNVICATDLLLGDTKGPLTGEQTALLNLLHRNARHALDLILNFRHLLAPRPGRSSLRLESMDLRACVSEATTWIARLAHEKNIQVDADLPPDPVRAVVDDQRMMQVLLNLLSNAVKFSDGGTSVQAGVRGSNGTALLWVRDQGRGIPPEEVPGLFKKYSRTSVRPTRGEGSSGLGLYIAKKITRLHGGEIGVDSTLGVGSVFWVRVPRGHDS